MTLWFVFLFLFFSPHNLEKAIIHLLKNAQMRLRVVIPQLPNIFYFTIFDISQTLLFVCQGFIFSSSVGGMDQLFENA